jgi:glucose-1-phosphate adenylyltransferase
MDYRAMADYHREVKADATVSVIPIPLDQAHRFGILTTDSHGRIENFVEKPTIPESNLASMGVYIFNKDVLIERLEEDAAKRESPHDFGYAIIPSMIRRDRVFAYCFNGYWRDIGTKQAYFSANMGLIGSIANFSMNSAWPVYTGEQSTLPARKFEQGSIKNSIVSPGCVIKGLVENSILSPGVWIEEQAEVKNSILMANTFVGYHSMVNRSILDEGVNISKYCYIGFGASAGHDDITLLGEDVSVPSHTAIGSNCRVLPHTHPRDFTASMVPSGTVLSPGKTPRVQHEQVLAKKLGAAIFEQII